MVDSYCTCSDPNKTTLQNENSTTDIYLKNVDLVFLYLLHVSEDDNIFIHKNAFQ